MAPPGPTALRAALVALVLAVPAAVAAPAQAAVSVDHVQATATETEGDGDGLVAPGESFALTERIRGTEPGGLTGISATLSTSDPNVTLTSTASGYPDLALGDERDNLVPFQGSIAGAAECGMVHPFTLNVTTAQGSAEVPFQLSTGAPGPWVARDSTDVPRVILDLGSTLSNLPVASAGRVKDVKVRIGDLRHTATGDLRIELIAPDGTSVLLADGEGGSGDDFSNTTFSDSAAQSIQGASAPFTGTFRPREPLSRLAGKAQLGQWKLKVSDERGADDGVLNAWGMDLRSAVCDGSPIASFTVTPNPVLPGETVTLDASSSTDPNGTIAKYEWDLDNDADFEVDNGANPVLQHSFPTRGTYPVRLRVTDNSGVKAEVTESVSVTQAPVASFTATPSSPLTGQTVTLNGSASYDPDGPPLTRFEWDLDGDGSFEHDTGAVSSTTTSFATPGTKQVRLRVTDQDGAKAVASVDVAVQNRPPTASFTKPDPAVVGQPATFDAAASGDPDGSIELYQWDFDGNGTFDASGTSPVASHTYSSPGSPQVKLRVTDDQGATHEQTQTVRVTRAPVASFTATPNPAPLNAPVTFDGSASSDPDGQPLARYEWDLDGNGTFETDTGATPTAQRAYANAGTVAVRLRVTDADGATGTHTVNVTAANTLPIARLSVAPNPALTGQVVTLDASASTDPDGHIVRYDWDLDGNGTFETAGTSSPTRTHAYPNPGTFAVGVRVTDNDGGTRAASASLAVQAPPTGGSGGTTGTSSGSTSTSGSTTGTSGSTGGGTSGTGSTGTRQAAASLSGAPIQRLRDVLARGVAVTCVVDRAATCVLRAELNATDARRLGLRSSKRRPVVVGRLSITLTRAGSRAARLRLTAAGKRALRRSRRVSLAVRGTASDAAGAKLALSRTFLLRR